MGADLTDRLGRLADQAPAGSGTSVSGALGSASDLWALGRRRQRARVLSGLASVVLLLVLAGLAGDARRSRMTAPEPAGPSGSGMRLPDHFFTPGAWLAEAREPIGPLVAVIGAERKGWLRSGAGLAGVSARTGEYRFLTLPGQAEATPALSPNGRWLAYWLLDERFVDPSFSGMESCKGLAVYNTVSGTTTKHLVVKPLGLSPHGLVWAGDTLWFDYAVIDEAHADGGSSSGGGAFTWAFPPAGPPVGEPKRVTGYERIAQSSTGVAPEGFTAEATDGWFYVVAHDRVTSPIALDASVQSSPAISPDGRSVAGIASPDPLVADDAPRPILVGTLPADDPRDVLTTTHLRALPGVMVNQLLGWRDATHVVALTYVRAGDPRIDSVDITTGVIEPLTTFVGQNMAPGKIVAADAWSAPVVAATEPRWPPDPRPFACAALLAAFAGAGYLLRRRRRARA